VVRKLISNESYCCELEERILGSGPLADRGYAFVGPYLIVVFGKRNDKGC
jgi:hypothetical protein